MLRELVLVLCLVSLGFGRRSPHADLIEEYYKTGPEAGRYSDNILEDAFLDVPGLITKYGYPVEVHNVVTDDGYILEMQRIPYGRDNHNTPDPRKPVVLVMHGLFASAADWVLMGPGTALGYILADAGYDVWLGNARGTYYSRNHVTLNPDSDNKFWKFSWEEIGSGDLPAMIDYALQTSGKSRLHYIGHSQGTTAFWTMASLRPDYNDKIITMQALAPVAFMEYNKTPLFLLLGPQSNIIERVINMLGVYELLPNTEISATLGLAFCADGQVTQIVCSNIIFLAAGRSEDMHNATMLPVKLGHTPAGSAVRQVVHYGQNIRKNFFRRFDHGTMANWIIYRSFTPPDYDLQKITAPVFLHYVDDDLFAHVKDIQTLFRKLGQPIGMFRVPHATFSHLDFMWGTGAKDLVYDRVINLMKSVGDD